MSFWAYLLHCRAGTFYTGHTDNLEHRVAQHKAGAIPGYTAERLPVELVWSQEFSTRLEALTAERQIKGWSRAKKLALIRGDWSAIALLAKGKDSPSTSSGQAVLGTTNSHSPVRPELVEGLSFNLQSHPSSPVPELCMTAVVARSGRHLRYELSGPVDDIIIPIPKAPARADNLWQSTCFELFVARPGLSYTEYNFCPSGEWAAYHLDSYRSGMRHADAGVKISILRHSDSLILDVGLAKPIPKSSSLGLSAVIEASSGIKSYWALAHPSGPPDFHDPTCFLARLPE